MPMIRVKDGQYQKLEELAVEETAKQRKIVTVAEMMHSIIDSEYQRVTDTKKTTVKDPQEKPD